jgi:serine/threonine-protein kinase
LVYVHENKVIHRDIKPANIMRRKDGKLVLIDFGIVKQINNTITMKSGSTKRTKPLIGTLGYMPIEQAIGKPKFSSDILNSLNKVHPKVVCAAQRLPTLPYME